jgi:hypothetical protein
MSVYTRLLSFGVTKGLAALLVLVLSVIGGVRSGLDRFSQPLDEEHPALVYDTKAHSVATNGQEQRVGSRELTYHLRTNGLSQLRWNQDHLSAPSHY